MDTKNMLEIKKAIANMVGWDIRDFELIKSGKKGGRPNWEIKRYDAPRGAGRYAFTAFDANDIYDFHKVMC